MPDLEVAFPCGKLQLEGVLSLPQGVGPFLGVAVCHPHPLYGGSMDNNVVCELCFSLSNSGIATLRFNFRGVGWSQGTHENGVCEQEDAAAALAWLGSQKEIDGNCLGLAGYSFGASVAIPVALNNPAVKALALVSPPLRPRFVGADLMRRYEKPKLIIVGGQDNFIPAEAIQSLLSELPEPKEHLMVLDADHFWSGHEEEVGKKAADFFSRFLRAEDKVVL